MRCLLILFSFSLVGCASAEAAKYARAPSSGYAMVDDMPGGAGDLAMSEADGMADALGGAADRGRRIARNEAPALPQPEPEPEAEATSAPVEGPAETKRLVIYTGRLAVMVASIEPAMEKVLARVVELGGYLSQRNDQTIVVRVPAEHFDTLVEEVGGMGTVLSRQVRAQDVTAQFRDLRIRIENAERSRARLLVLLEKAEKMEDVLKIEVQLTRVTAELESMKGQLRLLGDQIALSTLTVELRSNAPPPRPVYARQRSRFEWINGVGIENAF